MSGISDNNIAIIGAGLGGAVAARYLCDQGCQVTLFDKSRGTGGRLSSSRLGSESIDLGVPFFEPGGLSFNRWLEQQVGKGMLTRWHPSSQVFEGSIVESPLLYTAPDRLSALTRSLIDGCTLVSQKRISLVWPSREGVSLRDDDNRLCGSFDAVLVATPAPQAALLLDAVGRFRSRAAEVKVLPAWVTALSLSLPLNTPIELIQGPHPMFRRIVRDSAKPGRQGPDRWVVEAGADWSLQHRRDSPEYVQRRLLAALNDLIGPLPEVLEIRTHRWLYCHATSIESRFLWGDDVRIGVCGDWFGCGGVEGAFESGLALAHKVMQSLVAAQPVTVEPEVAG